MELHESTAKGYNPTNPFEQNEDVEAISSPPPAMPDASPPPSPSHSHSHKATLVVQGHNGNQDSNARTPPPSMPQFSPPPPPPSLDMPTIPTVPMGGYPMSGNKPPLFHGPTTNARREESKKKQSKKKKKKHKRKKTTYEQQYMDSNYHAQEDDGVDPPSILNFCRPEKPDTNHHYNSTTNSSSRNRTSSSSSGGGPTSTYTSSTINGNTIHIDTQTGSLLQGGPNTGLLNSSEGEGTTLPELLLKMRLMNLLHIAITWLFFGFNIMTKIVFLQLSKIVLAAYLLFFTFMLLAFEVVRGSPKVDTKLVSSQTNAMVKVVWGTALQRPISRRLRYFLQSNFGLLYSCNGRGLFLMVIGGVAIGQGWPMVCLGISYILLGLWTITLGWRYPLLEEALMMGELEEEFGVKIPTVFDSNRSVATWSSLNNSSYHGSVGEVQRLLEETH